MQVLPASWVVKAAEIGTHITEAKVMICAGRKFLVFFLKWSKSDSNYFCTISISLEPSVTPKTCFKFLCDFSAYA